MIVAVSFVYLLTEDLVREWRRKRYWRQLGISMATPLPTSSTSSLGKKGLTSGSWMYTALWGRKRPTSIQVHNVCKDCLWFADILDMSNYSRQNKGFHWILLCVDTFTRMAFAEPLK
jgi:hypothetical protein